LPVKKAKILIIDHDAQSRASLKRMLADREHQIVVVPSAARALERLEREDFDLVVSDLSAQDLSAGEPDAVQLIAEIGKKSRAPVVVSTDAAAVNVRKAFKVGATNYLQRPYDQADLEKIIDKALSYKLRRVENAPPLPEVREVIDIELPSDVAYMDGVLSYLVDRAAKFGIIRPAASNIFVALDEALTNAIRHGNAEDRSKKVRISAEISARGARFTIADEGPGFDVAAVPDPREPANLFKPSGRGVMLIHHIMDEVRFNERGNEITMVKFPEGDGK
jgi:serine/threonine-protein kinase RsbW